MEFEIDYDGNFILGDYVLVRNKNKYEVYDNDNFHDEDIIVGHLKNLYEDTLEQCLIWCWKYS